MSATAASSTTSVVSAVEMVAVAQIVSVRYVFTEHGVSLVEGWVGYRDACAEKPRCVGVATSVAAKTDGGAATSRLPYLVFASSTWTLYAHNRG